MNIEDELSFKALALTILIPIIGGIGFYIGRSIDSGEWHLKKQKAIYYEFNKIQDNQKPNKKIYFDWASEALSLDPTKNYNYYFSAIRNKIGKSNVDQPLFIDDFKKYIGQQKTQ